jgi:starch-binding outer membrane protein, SusD/RagB family
MKKIINRIGCFALAAAMFSSCHKIDVAVTSELTPDTYPQTEAQFNSVMGPVYTLFRSEYATTLFFLQSMTTDESLLPTYAADWIDGNRYLELHRHTWSKDNAVVGGGWNYLANLVGTTNQTIFIVNKSPDGAVKNTSIAELKTMRAMFYYLWMDMYGNIPLDTVYGNTELKPKTPRAQVFTFIENELKTAIPFLKSTAGASTYGKPTKYLAYSLLAKMYLNAEVYTGTQRNNDCIAACDSVMNAGGGTQYALEPRATYLQMFYPTNGPGMKEFVYAVPFDASTSNGYMFYARYDLNRNLGIRYQYSGSTPGTNVDPIMNLTTGNGLVNNKPSGPRCTTPDYFAYFNDVNDIRNKQWLSGLQYWANGNPIMVRTTNLGYDQFYAGPSPAAAYTYHLNITPLTTSRLGATSYDLGKDEIAWNTGTRNIKFIADYLNPTSRNQSNDVPVFRLSDIILMKAEAIQRGGTPTLGHTALSLVNTLKAVRTTSAPLVAVTLDDIYAERCREMAWECWHRNDMIRFGKFENSYGLAKTNADTYRRIFPIPTTALATNSKLVQNPGY